MSGSDRRTELDRMVEQILGRYLPLVVKAVDLQDDDMFQNVLRVMIMRSMLDALDRHRPPTKREVH